MARRRKYVSTMEAGVASPEYLARSDENLNSRTLKSGVNVSLVNGGGFIRRPGGRFVQQLLAKPRLEIFDLGGDDFRIVAFGDGQVQVYTPGGILVSDIQDAPWGADDIQNMSVVNGESKFYILSNSFHPRVLSVDEAQSAFTLGELEFAVGIGGAPRQPYWRYAAKGITLRPSGRTGYISLTASEDVFVPAHEGTIIRYIDQPVLIETVQSGSVAFGRVLSPLYPSISITVDNPAPFKIGHEVRGDTSGAVAQVASVSGSSIIVTMLDGYTNFIDEEQLSSPGGSAEIQTTSAVAPQGQRCMGRAAYFRLSGLSEHGCLPPQAPFAGRL